MRINKYLALASGVSRRRADELIAAGHIRVNAQNAIHGQIIGPNDQVYQDDKPVHLPASSLTIMLNKPPGYVCSRRAQGNAPIIYDLLPPHYRHLKPVGRLDKDSCGLLLLTNDGTLAQTLTHPRYHKEKIYEVELDKSMTNADFARITKAGVDIGDTRPSRFQLAARGKQYAASNQAPTNPCYFLAATCYWKATLATGRNRQIRRTFAALGYSVLWLRRRQLGAFTLDGLKEGKWREVTGAQA